MAARGAPLRTLQEALEDERRSREFWWSHDRTRLGLEDSLALEQERRIRLAAAGPLRMTDKMKESRETGRMMQEDPDRMEGYYLHGYKKSDFGTRQDVEDWAFTHISAKEFEEAKENIMNYGQTAIARVRDDDGFMRIDLEPVEGKFWVFASQNKLDEWERTGWKPHVSMTQTRHNNQPPEVYDRVVQKWDGKEVCIKISKVNTNGTLTLDESDGIGNDWNVWRLYIYGTFGPGAEPCQRAAAGRR